MNRLKRFSLKIRYIIDNGTTDEEVYSVLNEFIKKYDMDKFEFYRESQRFLEGISAYCFETDQTTEVMFTAVKWLIDIQDRCMKGDLNRMNRFAHWLKSPSTLLLKKMLSEYCNHSNLTHFNAFALIDNYSTKFKL